MDIYKTKKETISCLKPVIDENSKILILGSMPSSISREQGFYYANPTNRFWKILSKYLGVNLVDFSAEEKKDELLKNNIALFDVYSKCQMKEENSSLDSNIINYTFNDINALIKGTKIEKIYITSRKAYLDFIKEKGKKIMELGIEIINLPSPSSANRSKYKTDDELTEEWIKILKK